MDQEKITMKNKIIRKFAMIILPAVFLGGVSCGNNSKYDVSFSYRGLIDNEYRVNAGKVIPLTINQSIETDGDISSDGNFFYYSSNADGGNYDIYLRSMSDITTVRITSHPSKDVSPVISPDGKRLAFVSFRDDPEGDIYVIKLKAGDLLAKAAKGEEVASLDRDAVDLTIEKNQDSGIITNIRDSNPCWSPDGDTIAWSSSRSGEGAIWLMNRNGGSKKKISQKDGYYPSFSPDGKKIIYISYSENKYGDLYSVDVDSGRSERLTSDIAIKLYPVYCGSIDRIIYSSIEEDTNNNGTLDLQDKSVIRFIDRVRKLTYPLTKRSDTSFNAKWTPALKTNEYNAAIVYTDMEGENININVIPETGIIPVRENARFQYDLCETYVNELEDTVKYAMSLEAVFYYFGSRNDNSSRAYADRALKDAAIFYKNSGDKSRYDYITHFLDTRIKQNDLYASCVLDLVNGNLERVNRLLSALEKDEKQIFFAPFTMEDIADQLSSSGKKDEAASIYNEIISRHPKFERRMEVSKKISLCTDNLKKGILSESTVQILGSGTTTQKITVTNNLLNQFSKKDYSQAESRQYMNNISSLKEKYTADKKISSILNFASGSIYNDTGDTEHAVKDFTRAITLSNPSDLTYYMANIKLGEIERKLKNSDAAEKYYSAGIAKYSRRFKTENFRDIILWLINYYEQKGEELRSKGKYRDATVIYEKYINIATMVHNRGILPDIYSEYAPRAHVLYIDAYLKANGDSSIDTLEAAYKLKLPVLKMNFDRAAIYAYAYIFTNKAMLLYSNTSILPVKSKSEVFDNLSMANRYTDWALFYDDTFIEPYLLKSWIYQFIDLQRKEYGDDIESSIGSLFPQRMWEKNIPLLEKALDVNNEKIHPENEGNIHLNMGNSYYLLVNYPRALYHYRLAQKYKKSFGSDIENVLFHFHYGYTLWQDGEIKEAREEISRAYDIYSRLSGGSAVKYKQQILILYRYFALFSRYDEKYDEAISWYKKILRHADDTGLEIDRARYLQEIAYCYKETGDFKTAKTYIDQADRLLKDYPDDTRKYYLKLTIFGLGPFPVWNMGPDTAVVGENKIFYPLDTWNKKLLSISMLEDMALKNGDNAKAIDYLKGKIELLKESGASVSVETKIISLNNLGYYYFISGNPGEAEKYFKDAGDLAAEKNNREAMFQSITNLASLYALMIEDNYDKKRNWISDIEKFLGKIEKYRSDYYNLTLAQEREKLESSSKAKQEEVTKEQLDELKSRVESETSDIYYRLDTSIAIMEYYHAGLLYSAETPSGSGKQPYDFYTHNREIYDLYADALKKFESSIPAAEGQKNIELKVKLLMNAAACYQKTGDFEKAYVALIDAKNLSDQYRLGWTGINAYYSLGMFLADYGREVESGDYRSLAEKNISTAVSRIAEHPLLYSSRPGKIRIIYNGYSEFLAQAGRGQSSAGINERLARIEKIISVTINDSALSDENDRNIYLSYVAEITRLKEIREKRSSLLISGIDPVSPEIQALNKQEKSQEEKLSRLLKEIKNKKSTLAPYVELTQSEFIIPGFGKDSISTARLN